MIKDEFSYLYYTYSNSKIKVQIKLPSLFPVHSAPPAVETKIEVQYKPIILC